MDRFKPPETRPPTREQVVFTQARRAAIDVMDGANRIRDIRARHRRARSSPQHGTTFVVDLPADPPQPARTEPEQARQDAPVAGNGRYDLH